jgi:HK97 gp10 family phage protein
MPAGVRIEVIRNDFARIAARLPGVVDPIVAESAAAVEAAWKAGVHVRTGRYRDSIHTTRTGSGAYTVTTDVEYAVYQEFGTRYMAAHPAMVPAVEREQQRFIGRLSHLESGLA